MSHHDNQPLVSVVSEGYNRSRSLGLAAKHAERGFGPPTNLRDSTQYTSAASRVTRKAQTAAA